MSIWLLKKSVGVLLRNHHCNSSHNWVPPPKLTPSEFSFSVICLGLLAESWGNQCSQPCWWGSWGGSGWVRAGKEWRERASSQEVGNQLWSTSVSGKCVSDGEIDTPILSSDRANPPFLPGLLSQIPAIPWKDHFSHGTARHCCAELSAEDTGEPSAQDSAGLSHSSRSVLFTAFFFFFFSFF